eukprot:9475441-Pyramimonas_sp.AAC.1
MARSTRREGSAMKVAMTTNARNLDMRAPRANVISANDAARGNPGSTRNANYKNAAEPRPRVR